MPGCIQNYIAYDIFVSDEFNSGNYAAAYTALTRIDAPERTPHIAMSLNARVQLYESSHAFAKLYEALDGEDSVFKAWQDASGIIQRVTFRLFCGMQWPLLGILGMRAVQIYICSSSKTRQRRTVRRTALQIYRAMG